MSAPETLQIRTHGSPSNPALIYLPGIHGDWTLGASFREIAKSEFHFVEFTYPRSTTWLLADYAQAIEQKLRELGIEKGWLIGESFGSIVAWELLRRRDFDGVVLAGGFVRHPHPQLALLLRWLMNQLSPKVWQFVFWSYSRYALLRHRHAPETAQQIEQFVARRTPEDLQAIRARLSLVAEADLYPVAETARAPVYFIAGLIDPIVPYVPVVLGLRRRVSQFRGWKILWGADHAVLATQPRRAFEAIRSWALSTPENSASTKP